MAYVRHAESPAALNELLSSKSQSLVVIDFTAPWSAPCKILDPIIDSFAKSNPHVTFVKVDIDRLPTVAEKYSVTNLPVLHFIKNKSIVETVRGVDRESIRAAIVRNTLDSVASTSGSSETND
ncbi:hypothetical protein FRC18_008253, partial [Serendipita sp. 400]